MSEFGGRIIGEARDYSQLLDALRKWIAELETTMETIDEVAGLPTRYVSKLLAPVPIKGIGRTSLGPILGALGLKLVVAVDQETLEKICHRLTKRRQAAHASNGMRPMKNRKRKGYFISGPEISAVLNARRSLLVPPEQRSESARIAARERWRAIREIERRAKRITDKIEEPAHGP